MIDRPSGSWLVDENGNLTPNLADEAMAAREAKKGSAGETERGISGGQPLSGDPRQTEEATITEVDHAEE